MLHPVWLHRLTACCVQRKRQKPINEDRGSHLSLPQAEVFSAVGKPLPASFHAGVDITVIALWLGHESPATTRTYLHADMALKEKAIARTSPPDTQATRYEAPDNLLTFLDQL